MDTVWKLLGVSSAAPEEKSKAQDNTPKVSLRKGTRKAASKKSRRRAKSNKARAKPHSKSSWRQRSKAKRANGRRRNRASGSRGDEHIAQMRLQITQMEQAKKERIDELLAMHLTQEEEKRRARLQELEQKDACLAQRIARRQRELVAQASSDAALALSLAGAGDPSAVNSQALAQRLQQEEDTRAAQRLASASSSDSDSDHAHLTEEEQVIIAQRRSRLLQSGGHAPQQEHRAAAAAHISMSEDEQLRIAQALSMSASDTPTAPVAGQLELDIDSMDYDQLLELEEKLGTVMPKGAKEEDVVALPLSELTAKDIQKSDSEECTICLEDWEVGASIRTLPCFHRFHSSCIDYWLTKSNKCPMCKNAVGGS